MIQLMSFPGSHRAKEAYRLDYKHGLCIDYPYSPDDAYEGFERDAYMQGFDTAVDSKILKNGTSL